MKITALLALTATTLAAAPAMANIPAPRPDYRVTYESRSDRYCVAPRDSEVLTGTLITRVECKSVKDWAKQGVTIERRR